MTLSWVATTGLGRRRQSPGWGWCGPRGGIIRIILRWVSVGIYLLFTSLVFFTNLSTVQVYVLWLHLIFVTLIPSTILFCLNKTIHRKLTEGLISMRQTGHKHSHIIRSWSGIWFFSILHIWGMLLIKNMKQMSYYIPKKNVSPIRARSKNLKFPLLN